MGQRRICSHHGLWKQLCASWQGPTGVYLTLARFSSSTFYALCLLTIKWAMLLSFKNYKWTVRCVVAHNRYSFQHRVLSPLLGKRSPEFQCPQAVAHISFSSLWALSQCSELAACHQNDANVWSSFCNSRVIFSISTFAKQPHPISSVDTQIRRKASLFSAKWCSQKLALLP